MVGPALFSWLQDAEFYRAFHVAAVELMGGGRGRSWLDVGTGPGLLARLAAECGYRALGIDRSADMIDLARRLAEQRRSNARFDTSDIETELGRRRQYDVVSASSLVVVTAEPRRTLLQLEAMVAPGGQLLILEASPRMSLRRAFRLLASGQLGERGYLMLAWAIARSGRAFDEAIIQGSGRRVTQHRLTHGMVNAWIVEPKP